MTKIHHYNSIFQKIRYSKAYRAPKWILNKFKYRDLDSNKPVNINMRLGHKIKLFPTEQYLKAVAYSGQYHDQSVFLVEHFIKKSSTVIDIGANIGLYTCSYSQYFKDLNLNIFAVEAVKSNYSLLLENIKINKFNNIKAHHIALGKEEGTLELNLPSADFVGNVVGGNIEKNSLGFTHKESIKMITLDQFASENNITECDFIKIDIEGAEYFTFLGGTGFINKTRPVIQAEYNKRWSNNIGVSLVDYFKFFTDIKYTCAVEKGDFYEVIQDPLSFSSENDLMDLLFIPEEKKL
jgi:FkbM family methyltransferase